jgi:DNA-binding beta-propeller fold protein YncE
MDGKRRGQADAAKEDLVLSRAPAGVTVTPNGRSTYVANKMAASVASPFPPGLAAVTASTAPRFWLLAYRGLPDLHQRSKALCGWHAAPGIRSRFFPSPVPGFSVL